MCAGKLSRLSQRTCGPGSLKHLQLSAASVSLSSIPDGSFDVNINHYKLVIFYIDKSMLLWYLLFEKFDDVLPYAVNIFIDRARQRKRAL